MNIKVDEEFKYIHDEYLLQCNCTEMKKEINILIEESTEWESKYYDLQEENYTLDKENKYLDNELGKYKNVVDKIDKLINTDYSWKSYYYKYNNKYLKSEIKEDINKLLEEVE